MINKIIFKKNIIVFLCIIIVVYLGYLLFANIIEGYGSYHCNTETPNGTGSIECQSGNCFNAKQVGKGSFCAPVGFTPAKFRAAAPYQNDDTTSIATAANNNQSYWMTAPTTQPSCNLSLNDCARQNPSPMKYLCAANTDCIGGLCYDPVEAGKGKFCAPSGFTKEKYRVVNNNDDNKIIDTITAWASQLINLRYPSPTTDPKYCASKFAVNGKCYDSGTAPEGTPVGVGKDDYCTSRFQNGGACYTKKGNNVSVGAGNARLCQSNFAGTDGNCYSLNGAPDFAQVGPGNNGYCQSNFQAEGTCYSTVNGAPDGVNVGFTNGRYCQSGYEQWGKCTSLKPDGTNVGHLNGGQCQGGWAGDDDLCYSTDGTKGSGVPGAHVGNGRDRYCLSGQAGMGGWCK